jgi:hypothetical protein
MWEVVLVLISKSESEANKDGIKHAYRSLARQLPIGHWNLSEGQEVSIVAPHTIGLR